MRVQAISLKFLIFFLSPVYFYMKVFSKEVIWEENAYLCIMEGDEIYLLMSIVKVFTNDHPHWFSARICRTLKKPNSFANTSVICLAFAAWIGTPYFLGCQSSSIWSGLC
jgi:hypothetical protein